MININKLFFYITLFILPLASLSACNVDSKIDISRGWRISCKDSINHKNRYLDDSEWRQIDLPNNLSEEKKRQVIWLRKSFIIPESYKGRDISVYLGKIWDAEQTYFNGQKIGYSGSWLPDFQSTWNYSRYYRIPANIISYEDENIIAIRIFSNQIAHFNGTPFISDAESIRVYNFYQRFKSEYFVIGLTFITLFLGLFSLTQFFTNRKYKIPLYYAIVTIGFCISSIQYYLPSSQILDYNTKDNIYYALISITIGFIYFLVEEIINTRIKIFRILIPMLIAVCIALSLTATLNDPIQGWRFNIFGTIGLVSQLCWGILLIKSFLEKKTFELRILLPVYALFIFSVCHDILVMLNIRFSDILLAPFGYHAFLIAIGIVLSHRITIISRSVELKKYLPPQLVNSIVKGGSEVKYSNERKKLTIFFSDIKNFTETTDNMEPEELTNLLNEYLAEMTGIAHKHGGTVDKFIGDAIMIFFGAPVSTGEKNDAINCIRMAIEMQQRMKDLQKKWYDMGIEYPLSIRIGINTGVATLGNFGAENRLSYTIIGGQVNLASRLEGLSEPGGILVSYPTYALVKDTFECTSKGKVKVKGINRELMVYEVSVL